MRRLTHSLVRGMLWMCWLSQHPVLTWGGMGRCSVWMQRRSGTGARVVLIYVGFSSTNMCVIPGQGMRLSNAMATVPSHSLPCWGQTCLWRRTNLPFPPTPSAVRRLMRYPARSRTRALRSSCLQSGARAHELTHNIHRTQPCVTHLTADTCLRTSPLPGHAAVYCGL